ncbi:MAG: 1-acyl-sn-glycerol-3-phosphate acyltransferase [Oscillospiraceae bacterium]|jgi:1-acyl-sn-glycerol-3-phosphate acyltransferase|nr:1-acyl-sn-glycerol-3-phosphate acyltransferase [Oscillospiraceae bacterium]
MSKKKPVKKPNGFLYLLVYLLVYPFIKLTFRLKVDRTGYRPPKGPFVVLSNHASFMDFLVVMLALCPRRLNAVAARKFFCYSPLHLLLPFMGCIPKSLFDPDPRTILEILSVVKRGGRLLIFPEGRSSTEGVYCGIHKSTGKLIKKLAIPVVSCRIEGTYNAMPFWRKGFRAGRVRLTIENLLTAAECAEMPADRINGRIDARLGGEKSAKVHEKPLKVFHTRNLAEGLQNILYYCPACGREFTTEASGSTIRCAACGAEATLDGLGALTSGPAGALPKTIPLWVREQARHEAEVLRTAPIDIPVALRMPDVPGKGLTRCGTGLLCLDQTGWRYTGKLNGRDVTLTFPIASVPALPFDPDDNFQIYSGGEFYAFTPENRRACGKYSLMGECAYWLFTPNPQMTRSPLPEEARVGAE